MDMPRKTVQNRDDMGVEDTHEEEVVTKETAVERRAPEADAPQQTELREAFPADRRGAATANDQGTQAMGTVTDDGSFSQGPVVNEAGTNVQVQKLVEKHGD